MPDRWRVVDFHCHAAPDGQEAGLAGDAPAGNETLSILSIPLARGGAPTDDPVRTRMVNDDLAALVDSSDGSLMGLAQLPLPDVHAAVVELERTMARGGFAGAILNSGPTVAWDDRVVDPLFHYAAASGAVLFFHASPVDWPRTDQFAVDETIGRSVESALVVASLVFGGVLDRHPDLRAVIAFGGGAAPFGIGRMDRGWQVRREARASIRRPPSGYLRMLHYDTCGLDTRTLRYLIDTVGADRIVIGNGNVEELSSPAPLSWTDRVEFVSEQERRQILAENALRLLGRL